MKKQQILLAIVFGGVLAITGCGDDGGGDGGSGASGGSGGSGASGGSGGSGATGGGSGGDFCTSLCQACGGVSQTECQGACDQGLGQLPVGLDSCPAELQTLTNCFGANNCDSAACLSEVTAWTTCVTMNIQP